MHVASEVVEYDVGASDGLREHDPALVRRNLGQAQAGHGGAGVREETTSEELRQGVDRHEEGLAPLWRPPRAAVARDPASGDEQVDVRMPLERARPGVEHGERADAPTEPMRISAQRCERIEGGAEERAEEGSLLLAHGAAKLGWEREDDVEVRHRQEQGSLALEPATGGVLAALGAGPVMARVVEQMLASTCGALGEMAAECTGATARDRLQGADVSVRHGGAVLREVVLSVPANDVGEAGHGRPRLEAHHQTVEHLLDALYAGLRDVHVDLGGAQRLVAENGLDGAQRDAGFEQVGRVAMSERVDGGVLGEAELGKGGGEVFWSVVSCKGASPL